MSKYTIIKSKFSFLTLYGFEICFKQKHGSYYFAEWTNNKKNIMVLYDETIDDPVIIKIYDADSLGTVYDAITYQEEFAIDSKSPKEKIHCASVWLNNAILQKSIVV